ncbi:MAG: hypothetical protein JXQ73_12165 [Phycisphaerae bacterium]|nr:hypothetical protein [Phycisphaerae bacterium]
MTTSRNRRPRRHDQRGTGHVAHPHTPRAVTFIVGLLIVSAAINRTAPAMHQVAGDDFAPTSATVVQFLPEARSLPPTDTRASTRPTTTRATTKPTDAGLVLDRDGEWSLAPIDLPTSADAVIEDLAWVRFEGNEFGRCRDWNGRVEIVAFDAGGPRIAVRCSRIRTDGVLEYHDGNEWRQAGAVLRGGVSYLIRTVFRCDTNAAEIYLFEAAGVEPSLTPGRETTVARAPRCLPLECRRVRRLFRVRGGPTFSTIVKRWQLWDVSSPGRAVVSEEGGFPSVSIPVDHAVSIAGQLCLDPPAAESRRATFSPRVGLDADFASTAGWAGLQHDQLADEQGTPALIVKGLGSLGQRPRKSFMPPRAPFDVQVVFKLPIQAPPMRTIDLVRMVRTDTGTTIGPYVQLLAAMQDMGKGAWAGRIAARVEQPQPVIDAAPILPDTWYELRLKVDPVQAVYTGTLTSLGKDRPASTQTAPSKPTSVWGGNAQKFFATTRLPKEMALAFEAEGAYRSLGGAVELETRPSIVLPIPDASRPWANPATMHDMTYRDGRLEILSSHAGASLLRVDLSSGALEFVDKAFGSQPGQALAWDQSLRCYCWVRPDKPFLLERRAPRTPFAATTLPKPVPLHPNGRLAATNQDVFFVTWEKGIYRLAGKQGEATELDYRGQYDAQLRFAGVAASDEMLLLAGPYGAPNAGMVVAVDLASGRPIQRFSLRRYVQGITAMAAGQGKLYALSANDRAILSCDWPDPEALGLTSPTLVVARARIEPEQTLSRLDLISPSAPMKNLSGSVPRVKDPKTGLERFQVTQATLQDATPTIVIGDTLGQLRTMCLQLHAGGPARALRITAVPRPVGKPSSVYVAIVDEPSASRWPLDQERTTADRFFTGADYVRDPKSPLRQFKPDENSAPVFVLPAKEGSEQVRIDMVQDFAFPPDTWIGQVQLQTIGPPSLIEALSVEAADGVSVGPRRGELIGDVLDLGQGGQELIDWQSDMAPAGRSGDEISLWIRSADDRTELARTAWGQVAAVRAPSTGPTSTPSTTQSQSSRPAASAKLGRYLQWRLGVTTERVHEPPSVSTIRLVLSDRAIAGPVSDATPKPAPRQWWPIIFAMPAACLLAWIVLSFLRSRRPTADDRSRTVRKGRFHSGP